MAAWLFLMCPLFASISKREDFLEPIFWKGLGCSYFTMWRKVQVAKVSTFLSFALMHGPEWLIASVQDWERLTAESYWLGSVLHNPIPEKWRWRRRVWGAGGLASGPKNSHTDCSARPKFIVWYNRLIPLYLMSHLVFCKAPINWPIKSQPNRCRLHGSVTGLKPQVLWGAFLQSDKRPLHARIRSFLRQAT